MVKITYRPANQTDAPFIARLMNLSSSGVIEFLFNELVPGISTERILSSIVRNKQSELSYENVQVAVHNDSLVGIANYYPATKHRITKEMEEFFTKERLAILQDWFDSRVDSSCFLNTLSVAPEYHRQGIGSYLINFVKEKASFQGFSSVSLIVLADNKNAIRLYHRQGFQKSKHINIGFHPLLPHEDGAVLMNCPLYNPSANLRGFNACRNRMNTS
ncbi:MAG: GNAT family N-acetyltransferase [Nostoc sp. DedQUE05]|uniref:GNAT family N-acetyltransferase n=1 Tax=Nostoc sp. DedQUE05 TaxID=3075391 RepID=UPI002AD2C21B|nr:GNAT family N-acetyltransferase [Nostoc sp. DedQUE05]MDZ8091514.1 GNAT family N-acetyltransferase [Nostoc sp. DedQUE05]